MYVIVKVNNNTMYYLKEACIQKVTWTSNVDDAKTFPTKGQAEYHSADKGVKKYVVKSVD